MLVLARRRAGQYEGDCCLCLIGVDGEFESVGGFNPRKDLLADVDDGVEAEAEADAEAEVWWRGEEERAG